MSDCTHGASIFGTCWQCGRWPLNSKFDKGSGEDSKHYWLTPPELYATLNAEFAFDFDPCPFPKPATFDGLIREWGQSNYVNPPFGSTIHNGRKVGPTAWAKKAISEHSQGKSIVLGLSNRQMDTHAARGRREGEKSRRCEMVCR